MNREYRRALERYIAEGGEEALSRAYELGRTAVREGLSVLDLASLHHAALVELLDGRDAEDAVRSGGAFFLEALSAYEVLQRVLQDAREAARAERRQALALRRLSAFLADASLAFDAAGSLDEIVQLVAEHAREVVGARRCVVRLTPEDQPVGGGLDAPLTALDGRRLGLIQLFDKQDGEFSELDAALLVQLAQMASAAVERAQLYVRGPAPDATP